MRLIDADALKQECMYIDDIPAITERDIHNAPTIDAIPMNWMDAQIRGYASALKSTELKALVLVKQMWQKEQEGV